MNLKQLTSMTNASCAQKFLAEMVLLLVCMISNSMILDLMIVSYPARTRTGKKGLVDQGQILGPDAEEVRNH